MTGKPIGGVNVFGGGLALYAGSDLLGGLGVSGDTSCTDHVVAWRVRDALGLDDVPGGVAPPSAERTEWYRQSDHRRNRSAGQLPAS
jgi:Haem-degrading